MRRRLLIVLCCLIAGAVVNTLVAWGCALWSGSSTPADFEIVEFDPDVHRWHAEHAGLIGGIEKIGEIDETRSLGRSVGIAESGQWVQMNIFEIVFNYRRVWRGLIELEHVGAGWPCLAFEGGCGRPSMVRSTATPFRYLTAIELQPDPDHPWLTKKLPRMVPLAPIWSGFIINTLFYAALIWCLTAGPFVARRRLRKRRGRCLECAYPIGERDVCTECGKATGH